MSGSPPSTSISEASDFGEPLDIERLYREHFGFVCRSALRLGAEPASIDDIAQESFVVAARRLAEFEGRSTVRTWLFAITLRVVQSHRRWLRRQRRKQDAYAETSTSSERPFDKADAATTLLQLMHRLPESHRTVYILGELEGMSCAEIGRGLGLNPNTTYSRLRKAREQMQEEVQRMLAQEEVG